MGNRQPEAWNKNRKDALDNRHFEAWNKKREEALGTRQFEAWFKKRQEAWDNKQFEAWNKNTVKVYFAHGSFLVTGSIPLLPSARKGRLYLSTQRDKRLRNGQRGWGGGWYK